MQAGSKVDAQMTSAGVGGLTALHLATEAGYSEVMDILISGGSDVQCKTRINVETNCWDAIHGAHQKNITVYYVEIWFSMVNTWLTMYLPL